jgi:hypothetical protein
LVKNPAFIGDAIGHDPVKGADSIGADDQKAVPKIVDIADFSLTFWKREVGLEQSRSHAVDGGLNCQKMDR